MGGVVLERKRVRESSSGSQKVKSRLSRRRRTCLVWQWVWWKRMTTPAKDVREGRSRLGAGD